MKGNCTFCLIVFFLISLDNSEFKLIISKYGKFTSLLSIYWKTFFNSLKIFTLYIIPATSGNICFCLASLAFLTDKVFH